MLDGMGTYEPRPEGTAWSYGWREDPELLGRMLRQCYRDWLDIDQAVAFHVTKRLHEQLTGSINQNAVGWAKAIPYEDGPMHHRRLTDQEIADQASHGLIG